MEPSPRRIISVTFITSTSFHNRFHPATMDPLCTLCCTKFKSTTTVTFVMRNSFHNCFISSNFSSLCRLCCTRRRWRQWQHCSRTMYKVTWPACAHGRMTYVGNTSTGGAKSFTMSTHPISSAAMTTIVRFFKTCTQHDQLVLMNQYTRSFTSIRWCRSWVVYQTTSLRINQTDWVYIGMHYKLSNTCLLWLWMIDLSQGIATVPKASEMCVLQRPLIPSRDSCKLTPRIAFRLRVQSDHLP